MNEIIKINNKTITIINPHGYCAGVSHALKVALSTIDSTTNGPIYLLGNLIHNKIVTKSLEDKGIITIDIKGKSRLELLDYIESGTVIFSAHGVSDKVREKTLNKGLTIVDASCGKVLFIHKRVKEYLNKGYTVFYIGKKGHPEAESILEENSSIKLIETIDDINTLVNSENIYVTNQTTLSTVDTIDIYNKIKEIYPNAVLDNNICNATSVRQEALYDLKDSDLCIVVGDMLSSNSKSLVKIAKTKSNIDSILIESENDITKDLIDKYNNIAVTSSASCPEDVFNKVIEKIKEYLAS